MAQKKNIEIKKESILEVIHKNQEKNLNTINSENLKSPFNT
jgi:hypothetical protein